MTRPALLPIAQRGRREAKFRCELRLAQPHPLSHVSHIYVRHFDQRHANAIILAAGPRDRLLQSLDDPLTDSWALSGDTTLCRILSFARRFLPCLLFLP